MIDILLEQYRLGGVFMHPISIVFAVSIAIAAERVVRLMFQYGVDGASFMFEVQKHVLANDVDGAIRLCNSSRTAVLPRVIKAGLQRASRDEGQIQNAVDAASLEVVPRLERRLHYMALNANLATLLGLLGTISGLIHSFSMVEVAEASARQEILSRGIAEALNCTAYGLIVAIFTMICHSFLSGKASRLTEEIDEFGVKLIDLLSARKYRHSTEETL